MILDTTFIIDVMDGDEGAIKKLHEFEAKFEPQIVTAPAVFELYSGLELSLNRDAERRKIIETISRLILLGFDPDSAQHAGEIDGKLVKSGQRIDPVDSMIAGIALNRNEELLSRNVKHFSRIPGLKLESY